MPHTIPICADESVHVAADIPSLVGRYDAVNIKLDKAGGLTEALDLARAAKAAGLRIMVGCMVGTSLAMAPAVLLAQQAAFVDLDGPLLLAQRSRAGLRYDGPTLSARDRAVGVSRCNQRPVRPPGRFRSFAVVNPAPTNVGAAGTAVTRSWLSAIGIPAEGPSMKSSRS